MTNDFSLEPGELAFIYHRRWDEEKFLDNFKHDLAGAKAWGKTPIAIEQQTIIGLSTYLLTRLFLDQLKPLPEIHLWQFYWKQLRKIGL